jgi:TolB-like protein
VIAAAAIVLLATAAAFAVSRLSPDARAAEPALAVLPFDDLSPGGGQDYFAEGVAEEILSELASHGVKVIGRTSARRFADEADLPTLRRALSVSHVLEGSVRSAGGRTRVLVRLVQTSDGAQVWAEEFDREAGDIFAVQDQIGATVARRLSGRLGGRGGDEPAGRAAAAEVEAYNLYLAGRARLRERTEPALNAAEGLFARAVKLDPQVRARRGPGWPKRRRCSCGACRPPRANASTASRKRRGGWPPTPSSSLPTGRRATWRWARWSGATRPRAPSSRWRPR